VGKGCRTLIWSFSHIVLVLIVHYFYRLHGLHRLLLSSPFSSSSRSLRVRVPRTGRVILERVLERGGERCGARAISHAYFSLDGVGALVLAM
jgi:hypothetical protein